MQQEQLNINWYPGHMKKTKELLQENLKLVDIVVEVLDSRIPRSSKNPDIDTIAKNKKRIIILNKEDLSNNSTTNRWIEYYNSLGYNTIKFNSINNQDLDKVRSLIVKTFEPIKENLQKRGVNSRAPRIMIVGVPNSGKSSFINKLIGKKTAQTGDKPGVTKGKQWVRIRGDIELLDTPGILWPKFEDYNVAKMLSFTGAIKDDILEIEEVAFQFLDFIREKYMANLIERYSIDVEPDCETIEIMNRIAEKRNFYIKKDEIDYLRTAKTILTEFRSGMLGRISLEEP